MSTAPWLPRDNGVEYAAADDVQKHFVAAMTDLFCLAFLLTANVGMAEDCIIRSIRECAKSRSILKESLPGWVRGTVVRNGIEIVNDIAATSVGDTPSESIPLVPESSQLFIGATDYSAGILGLRDFDRLVYVICPTH